MSISTPKVKPVPDGPAWAATALLAAVLAVPATAMAKHDGEAAAVAAGHAQRTPTELGQATGEPGDSRLSGEAAAVAAGHAQRTPTELAQRTDQKGQSGTPSNAPVLRRDGSKAESFIASPGEPTSVAGSPTSTSDGFDWTSAAVGAGASMALVALVGVALLTVRTRRSATYPSASAS